jgi:ATP-dependent exoDNAse (exonuclease V) beta subunit
MSTFNKVLEIIQEKRKQNINLNEIAILLRSNDECSLISNFLLEKNINVTCEEMLSLENSIEIVFLINLLKIKKDLKSKKLKFEILKFLSSNENNDKKHDYISSKIGINIDLIFKNLLRLSFSTFKKLDLYDSVEYIVNNTNLFNNKLIYIQALLDLILDYNISNKRNKESFFEYWDRKKHKSKLSPPQDLMAVKVLTIHKSKGLQFPIVILPFFDSKLSKSSFRTWIQLKENEFSKKVLIQFSKSMTYFNKNAKEKHELVSSNMITDSLNLMYVALTRAQNENHIISKVSADEKQNSFSKLIYNFVQTNYSDKLKNNKIKFGKEKQAKNNNQSHKSVFELESLVRKENIDLDKYIFSNKTDRSFKGEVFHEIMERIVYNFQSNKVLEEYFSNGSINKEELISLNKLVEQITTHKEIRQFFMPENKIFNEREIYLPEGEVIRPDKILFHKDRVVSILDYKTGFKKSNDLDQLKKYRSAMSIGGFNVKKALLVYTKDKLEIIQTV